MLHSQKAKYIVCSQWQYVTVKRHSSSGSVGGLPEKDTPLIKYTQMHFEVSQDVKWLQTEK